MSTPPKTAWQDAFERWTTGVVIAGADTRIEYANPAFRTLLGRERSEIEGRSFLDLTHEDDRERNLALYNEVVEGSRDGFVIEKRFVRNDGVARWSRVSVSALRDDVGPTRMVAVIEDDTVRREAEEQLVQSEQQFRELAQRLTAILESITDAFFTLDREWRFTYVNQEAERLLERPREELLGAHIWDQFPDARGTQWDVMYTRAMESGEAVRFNQHYDPLDRWLDVRAYPSAEGLAIYFRDVTDERRAAELIRENGERFQRVARATADAIWDWDLRMDAVWWSEGLQRTFGIGLDDITRASSSWAARIHPDDHERVVTGLRAVIDGGGESWEDRYRFLRGDGGGYARVLDRGYVVRDDDGEPLRMVGGMSDETDRVEAERRVREQAELLAKAQDAIIVRELDHTITFWNPSAERLYGWSAEEAVGRRIEDLLYEALEAFRTATSTVLNEGEWAGELEQVRKDGTTITVEGRWTLVRDDDGEPDRILAINTDVTERKKLLAQFLRAQRMESIGTLAGGIAHDLNNVLAPILLSIELLRLDEEDPETRETLETIEDSARRGAEMVRQVLSFARGVESARVALDVKRVVNDVERVVRDTFPKNITFRNEMPDDLWPLLGDPTQIHQVLLNLFVNARDAMPDGGTLRLEAANVSIDDHYAELSGQAEAGPYVRLSVIDTGEGMPPGVVQQVFDPFFTTKDVGKGTGLGLSTVAAIVRSHEGFVNVYSEPGRGTTFRVYLPAGGADGESLTPRPVEAELPRGNGELILVVDDEASVRDITRQTLEAFGYRVLTATDGADAVARYGRQGDDIDLVLTDLMMPIMDGATLIRALRRMDPDVRIVAASGIGTNGALVRAADSGVSDFLPKPYTADTLLQVLARALGERD
ncbi:MAG: PAS domain S-box protein [Gemmatimonadota bacterium]